MSDNTEQTGRGKGGVTTDAIHLHDLTQSEQHTKIIMSFNLRPNYDVLTNSQHNLCL